MSAKNILLTGRPGVGKTTVVRAVVERLSARVGGFYTEEIREGGRRQGFAIVTTDGRRAVMAHVRLRSPHTVGRYGVSVEAIDAVAVPALRDALQTADVVVVDEIARMELCSPRFAAAVRAVLDSPRPVLGVVQAARLPFLDEVRRRPDVRLVEVTPATRDAAVEVVAREVEALVRRRRDEGSA
ncbi:MAG: NTPase [Armatimonadota bacterium]|nr:NTPase [Armatimonadota bacterium]MDR7400857.1 NTPase [Armatimonadota bacterium]MDR7404686.1 NTPase [Armatimonadota bacterium]MDR7437813.1 NTPase [Armatimonadota bacterium]MDR7473138.1 NTPase [Armatimonadota bacterium]